MNPAHPQTLSALLGLDDDASTALIASLAERGWTVAAAESLTAGLLTAVLTEVPGSSEVVRGGIVCYATDLKAGLVGVDAELLRRVGPVDAEVAAQLAAGVRARCDATIGVGLTGVAGPGAQAGHPLGTVFVALAADGRVRTERLGGLRSGATRWEIRAAAVRLAVELLAAEIRG